jgi:hypothetical protein
LAALNVRLPDQLHFGEEIPDLELGRLRRVRAVHRIKFNIGSMGRTDGPCSALAGSVAPISSRFFLMALSPWSTSTTQGPDDMNVQRLSKNGRALCTA